MCTDCGHQIDSHAYGHCGGEALGPFCPCTKHQPSPVSAIRVTAAPPTIGLTQLEQWKAKHASHKGGPYLDCTIGKYQQWHCPCGCPPRKEEIIP